VGIGAVFKVMVNTFFGTQALDEVQVAFVVLHAVALWIHHRALSLKLTASAWMPCLGRCSDNFRHARWKVLVNPVRQVGQLRT
jgi:hypothetical protein